MPRPFKCRRIEWIPAVNCFKPDTNCSVGSQEEVTLTMDEFEAIRLAELEELYHEEAAKKNEYFKTDIWKYSSFST